MKRLLSFTLLVAVAQLTHGQDAPVPQQGKQQSEEQQQQQQAQGGTGIVITASSDGTAIRVLGAAPLNGAFFMPMMMRDELSSSSRWLRDPQVQKELGLLDEQMERITELRKTAAKKQTEMLKAMAEVAREKRREFLAEMQQVLRDDLEKEIKAILLPHQAQRLEEVSVQMHLKNSGTNALKSRRLAELLGISERQKKAIQKKQAEIQRRLAAEIARLKKEAQDELIGILTPQQRKKLKSLGGKEFDHKSSGATIDPAAALRALRNSLPAKGK